MSYNIATGTVPSTTNGTANEIFTATTTTFADAEIADIIQDRMNYLFGSNTTKAINSYNAILSYVAAEAVIAQIQQTNVRTSSTISQAPSKINGSFNGITVDNGIIGALTGNVTGTVSSIANHDTDSLSEGSNNLYHTTARARAAISENSTQLSYDSSTGILTYTQGDTDTVSEGSSNLYHTTARAQTVIEGHTSIGTSASGDITIGNNSSADVIIAGTLTLSGAPTSDLHAATKAYVDGVAEGLQIKASVKVATTANGTLSSAFANGATIDGIAIQTGDRILIKEQTTSSENGIYIVNASGAPTRTDDFDTGSSAKGAFVFVEEGTTNADKGFVCTNNEGNDTVDTHNLEFTQFSGAGSFTGGTGVTISGTTISIGQAVGTTDDVTFATVTADSVVATSVNIDGGSIDGTTIGSSTAAAGTFSSMTATAVDINGGAIDGTTIGANSAAAGTFSAINHSAAIARSGNSELTANTASLVDIIQDLYAKITYKDEVITALLQQIDLSDSISSSNPFYTGAYTGTNSVTASYSLDYTAS